MKDNNNKKEFTVSIMETVTEDFIVNAKNQDEAIEIAKKKYNSEEFVLAPGNLVDVEFVI